MYEYILTFFKRPILKEISWYGVGQIGIQIFAFLGVITTARYLGPVNLGLYSFVQNYLAAFMTILGSMEFYFTWKVAKSDTKIVDLKEYIVHKLYVTIVIIIIGVSTAWILLPRDVAILATVLFTPFLLGSTSGFYCYAVSLKKAKFIACCQIVSACIILLTKITLVYIKAPLIYFVATSAVEIVLLITIITIFFLLNKKMRKELSDVPYPSIMKTIRFMYSIRMSLIVIVLWQLIVRVDQFVLAAITNAYTLGIYAAAVKIAEVPNVFGGILSSALIARIAFLVKEDTHGTRLRIRKILLVHLFIGIFFAIFIIIFAPYIVGLLYGSKFLATVPVLRAYALSIPGIYICLHYLAVYGAKDKHFHQSVIFMIGIIINIALIYILVPIMGAVGAALATSFAYSFVAIGFYLHIN